MKCQTLHDSVMRETGKQHTRWEFTAWGNQALVAFSRFRVTPAPPTGSRAKSGHGPHAVKDTWLSGGQ